MNAMPFDAFVLCRLQRSDVRLRAAGECSVPVGARMQPRENARCAPDVVGMGMRQYECLERASASQDVRQYRAASGIPTAPRGPRIEKNPMAGACSQENRVALTDVEDMHLQPIEGTGWQQWHCHHRRKRGDADRRWSSGKSAGTGDDEGWWGGSG